MKLKEVNITIKLTSSFDSFQLGKTWTIEEGEEVNVSALFKETEEQVQEHLLKKQLEKSLMG